MLQRLGRIRHPAFQLSERKCQPRHETLTYVISTFDLLGISQRVAPDLDNILPSGDPSFFVRRLTLKP